MYLKNILMLSILGLTNFLQGSEAQSTNLLQRYIKQYFSDYYPTQVRSYKLYGNGQNGAADFHAGLPYPYETNGKVNSLVYTTAAHPPLAPPKASSKMKTGVVENAWLYPPGPSNAYPSNSPNPIGQQPQLSFPNPGTFGIQQQSRSDTPAKIPGILVVDIKKTAVPLAESRMVQEDPLGVESIITMSNFNNDGHAEIPIQSSMLFKSRSVY